LEKDEEDDGQEGQLTEPRIVFNLTQHVPSAKDPGAIAVSREGHVFWTTTEGVLVVDPKKNIVLGKVPTPSELTSITLGEDGFLYLSTKTQLLRIRVQDAPVKVPTNIVV